MLRAISQLLAFEYIKKVAGAKLGRNNQQVA
jgi:hypothetical protein